MTRLLSPTRIGHLELPNRLAVAPMTRVSATATGEATERMARYYARFARGGFGLVVTEGIYTDQAFAQGYAHQPGLSDQAQALAWRPVVQAIHAAGGRVFAQLMHAGALSQFNRFHSHTAGPSAIRPMGQQMALYRGQGPYPEPVAMTGADIAEAMAGFRQAARLAIEVAGFDGVEIHGANGYLLDQFLTAHTNTRSDAWGGAIGQRVRLACEVVRGVRQELGSTTPLGVRISQGKVNDFAHRWPEAGEAAATVFSALAHSGADYLHVTEFEAWRPAFTDTGASLVHLARRHAPGIALIANGGLHDPARAAHALDDGADLVALGRGALSNPDWPQRLRGGLAPRSFDPSLLAPLGDLKDHELQQA